MDEPTVTAKTFLVKSLAKVTQFLEAADRGASAGNSLSVVANRREIMRNELIKDIADLVEAETRRCAEFIAGNRGLPSRIARELAEELLRSAGLEDG